MYKFFDKIKSLYIIKKSRYSKSILILFFTILSYSFSYSQSDLIQELDYNRDSRSLVFMLNSNGYSAGFRFSKRIDGFRSRLIDIDLAWVSHPKEQRVSSLYPNQSKFVFGKLNQLMVARLGYGRQKELFGTFAASGIAINFYYTAGVSIALLKPVYYDIVKDVIIDNNGNVIQIIHESETFDKETVLNPGQIYSGGSFFDGFDEIDPVVGFYVKAAVSFDINKKFKAINALEIGAILEVFHKELALMEHTKHQQYLLTMFVAYRFGKKRDKRINEK